MSTTVASAAAITRRSPVSRVHTRAWASELAGTGLLLFACVLIAWSVIRSGSVLVDSRPEHLAALVVEGLGTGAVLTLLIASPLGRSSGGHFNPAVSITFWLLRRLPGRDVARYVVAQMVGSIVGVVTGRMLLGPAVAGSGVDYAAVHAAPGWSGAATFVGEALLLVVLMVFVVAFLGRPTLAHWTPVVVGGTVSALIVAGGLTTGGSFNPARQLGPLLFAGEPSLLWPYLLGSVGGSVVLAETLRHAGIGRSVPCGLCGEPPAYVPSREGS